MIGQHRGEYARKEKLRPLIVQRFLEGLQQTEQSCAGLLLLRFVLFHEYIYPQRLLLMQKMR